MSKQQSTPINHSPLDGSLLNPYAHKTTVDDYRRGRGCIWRFNPWTGEARDARDIGSDPRGLLILPLGEPLFANALYSDGGCAPGWPSASLKPGLTLAEITEHLTVRIPIQSADPGVSYIGEAPAGAKLMAFGDKVFMVATGMAPHWVTPTGLVLMQRADGSE